jgi:hypothetical protein
MAARTVKIRHDEETRAKIRTSQLLNRLHDHVFGNADISQTQMKAIEILLRKTLPDLSSVSLSGNENSPVKHVIEWKSTALSSTTPPDRSSSPSTAA